MTTTNTTTTTEEEVPGTVTEGVVQRGRGCLLLVLTNELKRTVIYHPFLLLVHISYISVRNFLPAGDNTEEVSCQGMPEPERIYDASGYKL